jgi:hypothetical protein
LDAALELHTSRSNKQRRITLVQKHATITIVTSLHLLSIIDLPSALALHLLDLPFPFAVG